MNFVARWFHERVRPANPTKSYHSKEPVRIVGEVNDWQEHFPEALNAMKEHLARLKEQGIEAVDD
jgi:rifampin ADP-ribosylating transferase